MKRILISQRLDIQKDYDETRTALDINWGELLNDIGAVPVPFMYGVPVESYFQNIEIDGVLLTGGNDLREFNSSSLSELRDRVETEILKSALDKKIPVYGVCRGMQMITRYYDGGLQKIEGHVRVVHPVSHNQDSRFYEDLKHIKEVNSYHNVGVTRLPEGFIEVSSASDGSIEAIEHQDLPVFCQMWHPERPLAKSENNNQLLANFFNLTDY